NPTRASAGGLVALGVSVGLGCGVFFCRKMSTRYRREAQGAAVAVDASTPLILPPAFLDHPLQTKPQIPVHPPELLSTHG
ncbi:hydrogen cyanide synthase, partial [Pseudomonas aeruginosa]